MFSTQREQKKEAWGWSFFNVRTCGYTLTIGSCNSCIHCTAHHRKHHCAESSLTTSSSRHVRPGCPDHHCNIERTGGELITHMLCSLYAREEMINNHCNSCIKKKEKYSTWSIHISDSKVLRSVGNVQTRWRSDANAFVTELQIKYTTQKTRGRKMVEQSWRKQQTVEGWCGLFF